MSAMTTRHESGVGDVLSRSSSAELSSPPRSSPEAGSPSAQFANEISAHQSSSITVNPSGVPPTAAPTRKKPGRKPKVSLDQNGGSATITDAPKAKRTRKPRDPNGPPAVPRKRKTQTPSESTTASQLKAVAGPPERLPTPKIAESKSAVQDPSFEVRPDTLARPPSQNGKHEDIPTQRPIHSFFNAPPPPPPQQQQPAPSQPQHAPLPIQQQPVRTSGQNYDPIRSNYDPVRETVVSHHSYSNSQGSPNHPPSMNRASASPSISSLVDPPNQAMTSPSIATQSFFHQQQQARYRDDNRTSVPPSPTVNRLAPSVVIESSPKPPFSSVPNPPGQSSTSKASPTTTTSALPVAPSQSKKAMANENTLAQPGTNSKKTNGSATTSAAASPKPFSKGKDKDIFPAPPPLPGAMGAGLNDGTEFRAPTVVLNIPLSGETNKYINFTRLAEEQYGWDALHPRLAAQRDRLARVAAAGAALERNGSNRESGDEMSLDSGDEGSNVEMGGMSDGRTGTDGGAKKVVRKRKMKEDEYDKDDGFVDDSELLWEEQAAAANDGFFVYSGPLVPEVVKPAIELRADGAPKRGRGGRGSRGGATGRSTGTRGGLGGPGSRGGALTGPGSRGGSTTRKPRITKADRARMEQEKLEREKMGTMASMPGNYGGGMPQLASAANMGNTPMVFNQ